MRRLLSVVIVVLVAGLGAWLLFGQGDDEAARKPVAPPPPSSKPGEGPSAGAGPEEGEKDEDFANLFVADLGTARIRAVTSNREEDTAALEPAWAPDGRSLFYAQVPCDDCEPFLELVSLAGAGRPRRIGKGAHPSPIAGGRRFVYVGRRGGLYVGSLGRGQLRELAPPRESWTEPVVSPDGTRVAAITQGPDGRPRLAVMSIRSGRARRLALADQAVANPAWSPGGDRLAYAGLQADGRWAIRAVRVDGNGRRRISRGGASDTEPSWSPDGARIAFVRTDGGSSLIYVSRSDGTRARPLLDRRIEGGQPVWSPDGARLAFVAKGDG